VDGGDERDGPMGSDGRVWEGGSGEEETGGGRVVEVEEPAVGASSRIGEG
jgi:hypothetical protein